MRTLTIVTSLFLMLGCGVTRSAGPNDSPSDRSSGMVVYIHGALSRDDLDEIQRLVAHEDSQPILSVIQDERTKEFEVSTGIVRGPLDGGGKRYRLRKEGTVWKLTPSGSWVS
jgi:hypothetical protein